MIVKVFFPTVMKMYFESQLEVDDKSATLKDIKEKVFDIFWKTMIQFMDKHGSSDMVVLRDNKGVEITDDAFLKECLQKSSDFSAVFSGHPVSSRKIHAKVQK